ncbi:DUF2642 domain-containing protein [Paenibacillus tarimensis]
MLTVKAVSECPPKPKLRKARKMKPVKKGKGSSILSKLKRLRCQLLRLTKRVKELARDLLEVIGAVGDLRNDVSAVRSDLSSLGNTVSALQARVGELPSAAEVRPDPGIQAAIDALSNTLSALRNDVSALQTGFSAVQAGVSELTGPLDTLRSLLTARIGTTITIDTDAGTVTGVLTAVGTDFVSVQEASGAIVIIRLESIESFV